MSEQKDNSLNEESTYFTIEEEQIKLQEVLYKTTTSKKKEEYLEHISKFVNVVGVDKMESKIENDSHFEINNPFGLKNLDINTSSELEDVLNFDNIPNTSYNWLNDSIVIEIPLNQNSAENAQGSTSEENQNSFLKIKKKRVLIENIYTRRDNGLREVLRYFFNHYLVGLIIKIKKECGLILYFCNFPEKFIFYAYAKKNFYLLDYTFEQLLKEKELYKDKDPYDYYSINIKVIEALESDEYIDILKKSGYDKYLKMTYRNLFEKFLKSDEYKNHIADLINKKEEIKAKRFKHFAETFLPKRKLKAKCNY